MVFLEIYFNSEHTSFVIGNNVLSSNLKIIFQILLLPYKDKLSTISKNTTFSVILRIILKIDMKKENIKTAKLSSKTDETISISQKKAIEMGKILLSSNLSQLDRFLNR